MSTPHPFIGRAGPLLPLVLLIALAAATGAGCRDATQEPLWRVTVETDDLMVSAGASLFVVGEHAEGRYRIEGVGTVLAQAGPPSKPLYWFLYDGRDPFVRLSKAGPVLRINGRPVAVDLSAEEGPQWLAEARPQELKSLTGVKLSGTPSADVEALARLKAVKPLFLDVSAYEKAVADNIVAAVLSAAPAGLAIDELPQRKTLLQRLPLRYLVTKGSAEDLKPVLPHLAALHMENAKLPANRGGRPSADFLLPARKLVHLRLMLEESADAPANADLRALSRLTRLRVLETNWGEKDLRPLTPLKNLRHLLVSGPNISDVSAAAELTELRSLAIITPQGHVAGIAELKKLPYLESLVVNKELLEKEKGQFDELRKARPELRIEGFCLGSWLILVILPAGTALGLALRRARSPRPGRAA